MDDRRFDNLTRFLVSPSRRSFLSTAGSAVLTALLGWNTEKTAAKKKRRKKKKKPTGCTPNCADKNCGDGNGCGGKCITNRGCNAGQTCTNAGLCVDDTCTPDCTSKNCGDGDGCGGFCTFCPPGKSCHNHQCVDDICVPDCADKSCGDNDGCDGTCQTPQGCPEDAPGCCPDGCVDPLNDPKNCTYCGYDCSVYDIDCCCMGACMEKGSPYCTCDCCRLDDEE